LVKAMSGILVLLGFLVVFLSSFLVFNTLQALMDAQMTQIGILKTVGANRGQVVLIYVRYIFVIGLVAFALATPTANLAAFWLSELLGGLINVTILGRRALPVVGALQLGLALIIPQAAALLPILSGANLPVQAALSGLRNVGTVRRGTLDVLIGRIKRLTRPQRLALRNVYRRRGRLILTLVTLTLGGAVFIATFNVRISLLQYVDRMTQYFQADVNITLRRAIRLEEMARLLADVPGVGAVEGWSAAQTEVILAGDVVGDRVQLVAPPAESPLITPILLMGRWLLPGDQNALVVNEQFLNQYPDLHPGSPMRLRVNGRNTDFEVVGVFQMAGNVAGLIAYANYPYLSAQIGESGRAGLFRVSAVDAPLTPEAQLALARRIEARLRAENLPLIVIDTGENLNKMAVEGFNAITAFLLFMAILTALVGSIGLTGTMSLNVMERTREIGVLRAIGADNPTLIQMVMIEGMTIGLISWLLAAVLAIPIGKILGDSINQAIFGAPSILAFTPVGYVIWLALSLLLAAAASYFPARSAARLTIREVLAYE
jgi:putative ABC transport system permease protein